MSKTFKHIKRKPHGFGRGIHGYKKADSYHFQITKAARAAKGYRWEKEYRGIATDDAM